MKEHLRAITVAVALSLVAVVVLTGSVAAGKPDPVPVSIEVDSWSITANSDCPYYGAGEYCVTATGVSWTGFRPSEVCIYGSSGGQFIHYSCVPAPRGPSSRYPQDSEVTAHFSAANWVPGSIVGFRVYFFKQGDFLAWSEVDNFTWPSP